VCCHSTVFCLHGGILGEPFALALACPTAREGWAAGKQPRTLPISCAAASFGIFGVLHERVRACIVRLKTASAGR
jgi:hypothetical protein